VDDEDRLAALMDALVTLSARVPVVFPAHPRTKRRLLDSRRAPGGRVIVTDPFGYSDFLALLTGARLVLTDSGGVQEETTYLGVPCLTLRPNTERPVTVRQGTNRLVKPGEDLIAAALAALDAGGRRADGVPPLWDGQTAARIVRALAEEA